MSGPVEVGRWPSLGSNRRSLLHAAKNACSWARDDKWPSRSPYDVILTRDPVSRKTPTFVRFCPPARPYSRKIVLCGFENKLSRPQSSAAVVVALEQYLSLFVLHLASRSAIRHSSGSSGSLGRNQEGERPSILATDTFVRPQPDDRTSSWCSSENA